MTVGRNTKNAKDFGNFFTPPNEKGRNVSKKGG